MINIILGFILSIGLLLPLNASADCSDVFLVNLEFKQAHNWPMVFNHVEVFRRNNNMGMQQFGEIKLARWIDLPFTGYDHNFVGISDTGRIYHIIKYENRTIARPISGQRSFTDIFVAEPGLIAAVDYEGKIEIYDPLAWTKRGGLKSTAIFGVSMWTALTGGTLALAYSYGVQIPMEFLAAFVGGSSALQTSFVMMFEYMQNNTFPDGFVKTNFKFKSVEQLQKDLLPMAGKLRQAPNHFIAPAEATLAPKLAEELGEPIN